MYREISHGLIELRFCSLTDSLPDDLLHGLQLDQSAFVCLRAHAEDIKIKLEFINWNKIYHTEQRNHQVEMYAVWYRPLSW